MSLREYAKKRDVSPEAVSKAVRVGRLDESVIIVDGQPKIADAALADSEWEARTRAPVGGPRSFDDVEDDDIPFNEARRRREVELWRQARTKREVDELELAVRKGELVTVEESRAGVIDAYTVVKTRILGLAARVKQRLPHVAAEDVRVIDDLVREALEELADGGS